MKAFLSVLLLLASCRTLQIPERLVTDEQASADTPPAEYVREKPFKKENYVGQPVTRVKSETPAQKLEKPVAPKKGLSGWLQKPASKTSRVSVKTGKFVNKGTIIHQHGTGNTAAVPTKTEAPVQLGQNHKATDITEAGSDGASAATAKGASSSTINQVKSWFGAVMPYLAVVGGLGLLYSLLPLGLNGSGWLWVLLRKGRSRLPDKSGATRLAHARLGPVRGDEEMN